MTDRIRFAMLAKHNALRGDLAMGVVANGVGGVFLRKANKLKQLDYSCDLERRALCRAKLCDNMGEPPEGVFENSAKATNIQLALYELGTRNIQKWWSQITKRADAIDQIQNLYYSHMNITSFAVIATELTTHVGCAAYNCGTYANVVCHYQTTLTDGSKIYTPGPTCNKCEDGKVSCVNGLCPYKEDDGKCETECEKDDD
ncbi:SCP-like protein [Oesophagostomum dentatum]|uniref:SCP-like protein n=1 Tax=Oesophagostomum dentatum TaxID=61180 RepID=A0A0B1T610_OESDE|nr:SCP-like protein [Oesophagostomum dentatum]